MDIYNFPFLLFPLYYACWNQAIWPVVSHRLKISGCILSTVQHVLCPLYFLQIDSWIQRFYSFRFIPFGKNIGSFVLIHNIHQVIMMSWLFFYVNSYCCPKLRSVNSLKVSKWWHSNSIILFSYINWNNFIRLLSDITYTRRPGKMLHLKFFSGHLSITLGK